MNVKEVDEQPVLLIDLFGTLISTDIAAVDAKLAEAIGVSYANFQSQVARSSHDLMATPDGQTRMLRKLLPAHASDVEVNAFDRLGGRLLVEHSVVQTDAVELVDAAHDSGWRIVLASNCAPNARALIKGLSLDDLADDAVLSCEVGALKPEIAFFEAAREQLGVRLNRAVLVDDQRKYCEGAATFGIAAAWIDRAGASEAAASAALVLGEVVRVAACDVLIPALRDF